MVVPAVSAVAEVAVPAAAILVVSAVCTEVPTVVAAVEALALIED